MRATDTDRENCLGFQRQPVEGLAQTKRQRQGQTYIRCETCLPVEGSAQSQRQRQGQTYVR